MTGHEELPVRVSRRIEAPAAVIFQVLANPARHLDLDGSGMLRGAASDKVITGVGDVFVMRMYYTRHGDYEMDNHVVEYEQDRRVGWEPAPGRGHPDRGSPDAQWGQRWSYELVPDGPEATVVTEIYDCSRVSEGERVSMQDGRVWIESMTRTLLRLDQICTGVELGTPPTSGSGHDVGR
ncbi:polyketide cyclase [Phytohabitans rumicis]|uniref:Polyketide cyclase n=1 Tax=Phytohabitans rumicis TaxID=1076125 RepID=A0A6V8L2S6_9ACTN|nr:polyketide cyclase [Phytohabitans rumicis]GFJ87005.1 hypothetical protein Prum_006470 [Phytohabitans rumicis]